MNVPFRIVVKARGGEGVFHFVISAAVVAISSTLTGVAVAYHVSLPVFVYVLLASVTVVGVWFLVQALLHIRSGREWEFYADTDRLRWISRDRKGEHIDGEIALRDIRALIYRIDDGALGAYLEVEFIDGAVRSLPLVGAPSKSALVDFINYWRSVHDEIPIRNLENA